MSRSLHKLDREVNSTIPFNQFSLRTGTIPTADTYHGVLGEPSIDTPSSTPDPTVSPSSEEEEEENRKETPRLRRYDLSIPQVGKRLTHFLPIWASTTSDEWSLEIISKGYSLEFHTLPALRFLSSPLSTHP